MYVQYIKLTNPKARYPLLLWHGGGLTGVTWETKPDGQPGWQMYFLNAGHDVYVSDAVGVPPGRAIPRSIPESPYSAPRRRPGRPFGLGPMVLMPPIRHRGRPIPDRDFPSPPSTPLPCRACRAGSATTPRRRQPTTRSLPRSVPA
jgi:hypothetical protein